MDVSKSPTNTEIFHPDPYDCMSVWTDFDKKLKYVTIKVNVTKCHPDTETQPHSSESAFDMLMTAGRALKKGDKNLKINHVSQVCHEKIFKYTCQKEVFVIA